MHVCVCRGGGIQDEGGSDMVCLLLINGCIMLVDKAFQRGWGPGRDGREPK